MLKAQIKNNEIVTTGKVEVDDNYHGFCCDGFDWLVCVIFDNIEERYNSIWGLCKNPNCPIVQPGLTKEEDYYHGVSSFVQEDFEEMLASGEKPQRPQ